MLVLKLLQVLIRAVGLLFVCYGEQRRGIEPVYDDRQQEYLDK